MAARKQRRRCPLCNAEAVIEGRIEYGGGFVCWKREGGCGEKFADEFALLDAAVGTIGERPKPPEEFTDFSLENLLTHPDAFALPATPTQRAICQAADGLGITDDLWSDPVVRRVFGGKRPRQESPDHFLFLAAIRCGKSMVAAAKAIQLTQVANVEQCSAGDEIRIPVLSTEKDQAHAIFSHLLACLRKPAFKGLLVSEPKTESVWVRHPTGLEIEIKVTALARYGSTLLSRWLPGCIFDEAPRMVGLEDGIRNLTESLTSIRGRILPGGQIMLIGSPYGRFGPVFRMSKEHFGKPSHDYLVVRGTGPSLNPVKWTPEACAKLKRVDPRAYKTDVEAEFADLENQLIASDSVERAMKGSKAKAPSGLFCTGAIEPGTRSPKWTVTVIACTGIRGTRPLYRAVFAKSWIPKPGRELSPTKMFQKIAAELKPLGVTSLVMDQYASLKMIELSSEAGIGVVPQPVTAEQRFEYLEQLRFDITDSAIVLPDDEDVLEDLVSVQRKTTADGVQIVVPEGMGGYVRTLGLCLAFPPPVPKQPEKEIDEFEAAICARASRRDTSDGQWDELFGRLQGPASGDLF